MIHSRVLYACAMLVLALSAGCAQEEMSMDPQADAAPDISLTKIALSQPVNQAVINQHVLYPYHFVANSEDLNELGMHDVFILAEHFKDHPGAVNIRRAGTAPALYQARVETVRQALAAKGIDIARITVEDALPAGDGMASSRVLKILEQSSQSSPGGGTVGYGPAQGMVGGNQ